VRFNLDNYFNELRWEVLEVWQLRDVFTILLVLLEAYFEPVQRSDAEVVHFGLIWLFEGVEDKSQGISKRHVAATLPSECQV
jgi:hypothetical protein